MKNQKLETFVARIIFKYVVQEGEGRTVCYIYNRESLDELLNIKRREFDQSQFITIGDIITLEEHKCKVVGINFKLEEEIQEMEHGYGINVLSPSDPTNYNCQIGVFIERLD